MARIEELNNQDICTLTHPNGNILFVYIVAKMTDRVMGYIHGKLDGPQNAALTIWGINPHNDNDRYITGAMQKGCGWNFFSGTQNAKESVNTLVVYQRNALPEDYVTLVDKNLAVAMKALPKPVKPVKPKPNFIVSKGIKLYLDTTDEFFGRAPYGGKLQMLPISTEGKRANHGWLTCKDYFNDFLYHTVMGTKGHDYGPRGPVDFKNFRVLLKNGNFKAPVQKKIIKNGILFANDMLKYLGMSEQVKILAVYEPDKTKDTKVHGTLIYLPEILANSGPLLALIMLCIRSGMNYTKKYAKDPTEFVKRILDEASLIGVDSTDQSYWVTVLQKGIPYIKAGDPYKIFEGSAEDKWRRKVYTVHSDFGIVTFSTKPCTPYYSGWGKL